METQNVTVSLPKSILRRVKIIAAERHTSVSGMLVRALEEIVGEADRYERARRRHLALLDAPYDLGTHGKLMIDRDSLHER